MRRLGFVMTAAIAVSSCGSTEAPAPAEVAAPPPQAQAAPAALPAVWTATDGIKNLESVYYDAASGSIFSSQIDGAPDGVDGDGHIVKLDSGGKVVSANFTSGLNTPKGLRDNTVAAYTLS